MKKIIGYFSKGEIALWCLSVLSITVFFAVFDGSDYFTLITSLVGVTSLIFIAKGNPVGQLIMILFGVFYGVISYSFAYYGEMITYLCMTAPMALFSLISWLKNPYSEGRVEVKVATLTHRDIGIMLFLTAAVTVAFYFILEAFRTANLLPSTLSVATSFIAVWLTFKRSPYYALAYAVNDIVLITLWILAAFEDISYISVTVCFAAFLANDLYAYFNWRRIQKRQSQGR